MVHPVKDRRPLIEKENEHVSVVRQCELLGISRASLYYEPDRPGPYELLLMQLLDEQYTKTPFYGSRRMTAVLRSMGHAVNRKRVVRLMNIVGIEAIYPKPNTSAAAAEHKIYPYLLRGVKPLRPNHIWSCDITYIRLFQGFAYLVAVIDWYSRYVLSWRLSNTLDVGFCLEALHDAISRGGKPEIFNTDQGPSSQAASSLRLFFLTGSR